jgi:hypothetical protein
LREWKVEGAHINVNVFIKWKTEKRGTLAYLPL